MNEDENHRLHEFFQALFAYLQQRLGPGVALKDLARIAREALAEMNVTAVSWSGATRMSIVEACTVANALHGARIVGHVQEMADTTVISVPTDDDRTEDVEVTEIVVEDLDGETICSLGVVGQPLIEKLRQLQRQALLVEFLGCTVLVPVVRGRMCANRQRAFFLQVLDAREAGGTLDLLGATDVEREKVEALRQNLVEQGETPLAFLRRVVTERLRIVAADKTLLGDLVEYVVLQAVSCGWIDHAPGKLHLLLVGPPGRGKKLVGLAAKCLNPVTVELSPIKATPAGLVGSSVRTAEGWRSIAGALPRAAHGVAVLQDAHAWPPYVVRKNAPVLQEVIEDGVVRDSVAGGRQRSAPTSLVIDLNRASQSERGYAGREAPLLSVRPLLSRIDVIVEIPPNAKQPWEVAAELADSVGSRSMTLDQQPWVRTARLLVALLRDAHVQVDLTGVRPALRRAVQEIARRNAEVLERLEEAGDVPVRLVISAARLITASARACDRSVANEEDLARAVSFINRKLSFLRMHGVPLSSCPDREDRQAWVAEQAAHAPVRPDELARAYTEQTGEHVDERTIRRDLRALGAHRVGKGKYLLPPKGGTGHSDR